MKLTFLYNGEPLEMKAQPLDGSWQITVPSGIARTIVIRQDISADGGLAFEEKLESEDRREGGIQALPVANTARGVEVAYRGRTYVFAEPKSDIAKRKTAPSSSGELTAPMVGIVADVLVSEGDLVAAYQPLAIVEAMKVMATIEAPFAGHVARVYVKKGAQLAHGEPVMDIEPVGEN